MSPSPPRRPGPLDSAALGLLLAGLLLRLFVSGGGAPVEGKVHDIENHGIEKILTLRVGDQLVRAAVPGRVTVTVEDAVRFGWNPDKVIFFDAKSGMNLAHKAA